MNRAERRARASLSRRLQAERPLHLTRISDSEILEKWRFDTAPPFEVWISREFLVQVYAIRRAEGQAPCYRVSVSRTTARRDGDWHEDITWLELQRIKREIGRGEMFAVEVFPPDADVVNVANMRHLWFFSQPLDIGWRAGGGA